MQILIADDHDMVLETIAAYVRNEIVSEISTVSSLPAALSAIKRSGPFDLVLLDYDMPGMNGLDGLTQALQHNGGKAVAILSGNATNKIAQAALEHGAIGFLPKTLTANSMINAIRFMLSGEKFVPVSLLQDEQAGQDHPLTRQLTRREFQVLEQLCRGRSNKEIALTLGLQEVTIKLHVRTLCRKLNVKNRTQAALTAKESGLF
ncbi:response regulator transcription factor [Aliisedimentitalea scapharcae]|uniref:Response regulator transcription factor n=1 Tax=Aliisedimentitalea scapharcae TaxID=1524259 RepID=A0ABZ2XQZ5_9RHOB|nr:response regulator transcription factor [Rhodobacteraceae bacterium M382]